MSPVARRLAAVAAALGLSLAACSSTDTGPGAPSSVACENSTAAGQVAAKMKDTKFAPEPIQAKVGEVVAWTNEDAAPHNATITGSTCATKMLSAGQTGAIVFTAPGTYPYTCTIHPTQMKGTIVVTG